MASYRVKIKSSAQKEIRKLPTSTRKKVVEIIDELYKDPLPNDAEKIKGSRNTYRIRQGVYRIVYELYKNELLVVVIRVRHRKAVYKNL